MLLPNTVNPLPSLGFIVGEMLFAATMLLLYEIAGADARRPDTLVFFSNMESPNSSSLSFDGLNIFVLE